MAFRLNFNFCSKIFTLFLTKILSTYNSLTSLRKSIFPFWIMQMKAFGVANTFGAFMVEGTFCYLPKMAYY